MHKPFTFLFLFFVTFYFPALSQQPKILEDFAKEAEEHSQLETLAHELMDVIGPRLVGTPQMKKAREWAVEKFDHWGISAENQEWGTWRGWERGVTHIDLIAPRTQTLTGRMLAWSPGTNGERVSGEVITLPEEIKSPVQFKKWLPQVKGKFVLISMPEPTGRPDANWEKFALPQSFEKMKRARKKEQRAWRENLSNSGYLGASLSKVLEDAGALGILSCYWSKGFGTNKVFGAHTLKVPSIDLELEDYGMLYRLVKTGNRPEINLVATAKDLGRVPTFNTIARIEGGEKPEEYVLLSAHFDSWDGAQGATDNGTGSILMMETARILKKLYPHPKRTILVGLWGSEEQGLNGSRAFVKDHPEIVEHLQAVFNQDNGTGRIFDISGSGFVDAYDYLGRWLSEVPDSITEEIKTDFPGMPATGGTDHASFVAAGVPAFNLFSTSWDYWDYTWHTNRDTYDKIIFDDLRRNVILTTILTYMASEDPQTTSRKRREMPTNARTGKQANWPEERDGMREGGLK